jgi:UDP-N-acetylmuramyl pentapeptide phosphotransferase/UDP-N-acetylglucosamine-1-phosphate transferase
MSLALLPFNWWVINLAKHTNLHQILFAFCLKSIASYVCVRYPLVVFVGDTYTYFAGMALAVVSILAFQVKILN